MREESFGETPAVAGKHGPWKTLAVTGVLVAAIVAGLWLWRGSKGGNHGWQPPGAIDVTAITLAAVQVPLRLETLGEIRAVRQVTLAGEVGGRISAMSSRPRRKASDISLEFISDTSTRTSG